MKKTKIKRLFVIIRKFIRLFFIPEKDFDKAYSENRINYIVSELMLLPVNERFKIIEFIKTDVIDKTVKEKDLLKDKLNKIIKILDEYEKI